MIKTLGRMGNGTRNRQALFIQTNLKKEIMMKKSTPTSILAVLCVFGIALVLSMGAAQSAQTDLTATLHEAVANLTPGQQAALLILLEGFQKAPAEETAVAPQSAKDALFEALREFETASEEGTLKLESFYPRFSEDFSHWGVNGKEGALQWLEMMSDVVIRDGKSQITFDLDDVEIEEDGDKAIAYPIAVDSPIGSAIIEIEAQREADGVWRIVGIDGL